MRKIDLTRILNDDIRDLPLWGNRLMESINKMLEYIQEAFVSNISIENLKVQTISYTFTAPFKSLGFAKTKQGKAAMMIMSQIVRTDGVLVGGNTSFDWHEENSKIMIDGIYSIVVGVEYKVTFMVFY